MKTVVRRPTRRRSQTRLGRRSTRLTRSYSTVPLPSIRLPALDVQRSAAVIAVAGLMIMLLALFVLPQYAIATIVVRGNQGTATQDLEDALAFARGQNAFLLKTSDVAAAVAALHGIEEVRVRVILPNRLEVTVRDLRPEVAWVSGNLVSWVDKDGVVCEPPSVEPERRIVIRDTTGNVYQKGDMVDKMALQAALTLSLLMQRDIQEFEFQRSGELVLVSNQGWKALFNTRADLEQQVNALRGVQASGRGFALLDVRVPTLPSVPVSR